MTIWEVYVRILGKDGRTRFFDVSSQHVTKEGAERAMEVQKENAPYAATDPNCIIGVRETKLED